MKKIVVNICDATYEKLRLECINEKKSIQEIIQDRIYHKPFTDEIQLEYERWIEKEINLILGE